MRLCLHFVIYILTKNNHLVAIKTTIIIISITIIFISIITVNLFIITMNLLSRCSISKLFFFVALLANEPNFSRSLSKRKQLAISERTRQYFHNNIIQIVITLSLLVIGDTQKRIWKWHYLSRRSQGFGRRESREPIRITVNLNAAFWLVVLFALRILILRSRGVKWLEMRPTHPW